MYSNNYIPDYTEQHAMYEAEQERRLRRLPKCFECGERITDEECYKIGGKLYCEGCIEDFKVYTENYKE